MKSFTTAEEVRLNLKAKQEKAFEQLIQVIIYNIEYNNGVLEVSGSLAHGNDCYTYKDLSSPKVLGILESLGYTITMVPNGLFSKVIFSALKETE